MTPQLAEIVKFASSAAMGSTHLNQPTGISCHLLDKTVALNSYGRSKSPTKFLALHGWLLEELA